MMWFSLSAPEILSGHRKASGAAPKDQVCFFGGTAKAEPVRRMAGFGSPAILRTGSALAVPPKKQTWSLGAAPLAFRCPERISGADKENHIMYQNRATLIGFLGK